MPIPSLTPAETITAPDMARRVVAVLNGPEWLEPVELYEDQAGGIKIRCGAPDPAAQMQRYKSAIERVRDALRHAVLVARVWIDGRLFDVTASYWDTGSADTAISTGRMFFTGGPPPGAERLAGRPFFVEKDAFEVWLTGATEPDPGAASEPEVKPAPKTEPEPARRTRGAYRGELHAYMVLLKPELIAALSDDEIAQRFADHVAVRVKAGRSKCALPQLRNVANQVAKLRTGLSKASVAS